MLASLSAVRTILDATAERYRETTPVLFRIDDPYGALAKMKMPGIIIVSSESQHHGPLTYVQLDHGAGDYVCQAPKAEISQDGQLVWNLLADLQEPWIRHEKGFLRAKDGMYWHQSSLRAVGENLAMTHLILPAFEPPVRHRNAKIANFGLPMESGMEAKSEEEMWTAVQQLEVLEKQQTMKVPVVERQSYVTGGYSPLIYRISRALRRAIRYVID
jgi:hypothetical protein